jgi:hypothetical protein
MPLPRINVGDTIRATHLQQICDEIQQNRIRPGVGVRLNTTSGGTTLSVDLSGIRGASSSAATPTLTPFQIVSGYPAIPTEPVVRIQGESYVSVIETGGLLAITGDPGLGAIIGGPNDNEDDPGQFPLPEIGESVWLEAEVSGFNITAITVKIGEAGASGFWENYPDPVEVSVPDPETPYEVAVVTRCLIAHVVAGDDPRQGDVYVVGEGEAAETRKVLQQLKTNLGVQVLMMRGTPAPVLVPWHGPFIIP